MASRKTILESLFISKARLSILSYLFFNKSSLGIREASRILKISPSAIKREFGNLSSIGILTKNNSFFELNNSCVFLKELKQIFIKTDFIYFPIKEALSDKKIYFALIFGSFANSNFNQESDIDLLIIGDLTLSEVYKSLKNPEERIQRTINPILWKKETLLEKKNSGFVRDIMKKNKIFIIGDENEFRKIIG